VKPARRTAIPSRGSLPRNVETSLLHLELGHALANGGKMTGGKFSEKVQRLFDGLDREGVDWVLVGAQAVNLYIQRPRATIDVDIVVRQKHLRKAKKVLKEACGEVEESEVHFRGKLSPAPALLEVDLINSDSHPLFEMALDRKIPIDGVPVPGIEALLALKYLSAVSPWRKEDDKHQDVTDFIRGFRDNRARIDRVILMDLASRAPRDAGADFEKFLHAVENGLPITI
jgi:hypothetical protein